MTKIMLRERAEDALDCFERARDALTKAPENIAASQEWGILFMIGKCHEKIAGTYDVGTEIWSLHANGALTSFQDAYKKGTATEKSSYMKDKR